MDDSLVLEPEVIWYISQGQIERFAALVASAEREECAKLREMLHPFDLHNRSEVLGVMNQALDDYQELIRGRGNVATNDTSQERVDKTSEIVHEAQRTWVGLMRGVRVEGDTVVISVKGGNDAARELCGALIEEMNR